MTCVVGVTGKNGVLLAADAMFSDLHRSQSLRAPKVLKASDTLAFGYCGSLRLGQLITYYLAEDLDDPPLGVDEARWVVRTLVPALREIVIDYGVMRVHHNVELLDNSDFLLAVRNRLFIVGEDFSVCEADMPFNATGSGQDVAIGAMDGLVKKLKLPLTPASQERVALAGVHAATEHTPFVGGPVSFLSTVAYTEAERAFAKKVATGK